MKIGLIRSKEAEHRTYSEAIDPLVEPEPHQRVHCLSNGFSLPVKIRLLGAEEMEKPFVGLFVVLPGRTSIKVEGGDNNQQQVTASPWSATHRLRSCVAKRDNSPKDRSPIVRWRSLAIRVRLALPPDVPVSLGVRFGGARGLKPSVFVGGVVHDLPAIRESVQASRKGMFNVSGGKQHTTQGTY